MSITQISRIQVRTGNKDDLPVLSQGEIGYALDTKQVFIGTVNATDPSQNVELITSLSPVPTVGNDSEVLFNDHGNYAGDANLKFQSLTGNLQVTGSVSLSKNTVSTLGVSLSNSANTGSLSVTKTSNALVLGTNIIASNNDDTIISSINGSVYRNAIRINASTNGGIQFFTSSTPQTVTAGSTVSLTESVRITGAGQLAVNVENPSAPLAVKLSADNVFRTLSSLTYGGTEQGLTLESSNLDYSGYKSIALRGSKIQLNIANDSVVTVTSDKKVGILTAAPTATLHVNGSFAATSKNFSIKHPTKERMTLQHGSLEGPEHGVYFRGRCNGHFISLPDYWTGLVDENTISVTLTPIGRFQPLYVQRIVDNAVFIWADGIQSDDEIECYFTIYAERKDIPKLEVEVRN